MASHVFGAHDKKVVMRKWRGGALQNLPFAIFARGKRPKAGGS